jgi:beta-barrel assembly-enhancing protease
LKEETPAYVAEAYNVKLGTEPVGGQLTLERLRLQFISEQVRIEIPLGRLQIQKDDAEGERICFSSAEQPDWVICTSDSHILRHAYLQQQPHTRDQIRAFGATNEIKRRVTLTLSVIGGFALIAVLISALTGIAVRAALKRIPPEWEQQVGNDLIAEMKQEETFIQDIKMLARLDQAVAPLLNSQSSNSLEYKFYILQDPLPNAFALPGGHVIVTTRLLELAERPEELAGVVAHEVAHVTQKHGFRQIISGLGPFLIFKVFLGNSSGVLPILGEGSEILIHQSFSQEYELEADDVGWQSLVAAHIDPRGLASMLRKLEAEDEKLPGSAPRLNAFSTHPTTAKRVQRLNKKWEKLANKSDFRPL